MKNTNERFVTEEESNNTVKNVFIVFGYVVLSIVVTMLLVWSYTLTNDNQYMFITIISTIVLIYSIVVLSITLINKNLLDKSSYTVLFGFTIFMLFLTFSLATFFVLKYFNIFSSQKPKGYSLRNYDF